MRGKPGMLELDCRGEQIDLSSRTHVMGVINVTPDSFSDGGRFFDPGLAVAHGIAMVAEGADFLDVGGESTRPGSDPVTLEEELRRVLPVVERLAREVDVPVSVDTYKAAVAERALDAGAAMVNDISALSFDLRMAAVVGESGAAVVLMHIKGTPKDMQNDPNYDDVVGEISEYLERAIERGEEHGIRRDQIIVDPGIGFGKRQEDNLVILSRLREFTSLAKPILVGPSRKSFIGRILDLPVEERLEGTSAAIACAILNGANIVRVHDVREMVRVARVADAIAGSSQRSHPIGQPQHAR
ncbi:dihydropteroate synthase [candidate division TA06 bacterium SM23_40]|uniref:Dihydropteroate synthase n=1 Tax=candidate division TA06 bacterium SM23_40 TaxID=1703774 RepID=A0A0S8GE44_UNCT6|nr:MAG: dihydropteroate synthase [candidate division TA06 bacterium SM23_40]